MSGGDTFALHGFVVTSTALPGVVLGMLISRFERAYLVAYKEDMTPALIR